MGIFKKRHKATDHPQVQEPAAPAPSFPDIHEKDFWDIHDLCRPFTMTSTERMYSLYRAVNYVLKNNIPGDFVECGVWKGGSALLMAKMLARVPGNSRKVILYDTYEGMPPPSDVDKDYAGTPAESLLESSSIEVQDSVWCYSSFDEVRSNIALSGLPEENMVLIKGKVEDTIPVNVPVKEIAILRLDTDWYESTKHELNHLYPMLVKNGVLIIDDYGHWEGCRKAVDEYISEHKLTFLLNRIDNTGRLAIKNV